MSTAPLTAAEPRVRSQRAARRAHAGAVLAALLSIGGLFAIYSTCIALWAMWINDPLKSIGGLIPLVALVLILRVWRWQGWEMDGNAWGLAILAATVAVVHWRDQAVLELVLSPSWSITLPPYSLVAVAYTAGVVVLFGGMRLLRAAWFPVLLMWFVNPVPHFFNRYIDLPLQHASAIVARGFAHALSQPLTPDQLSLMFTPKFGMFIAPGCNGIRGAITMGFIALVAAYLYRLRWWRAGMLTVGAVLLGYLFNFARLCLLVVYYVLALRHPWLQEHAAMGDYILGACLFFGATVLLFSLLQRWSPQRSLRLPLLPTESMRESATQLRGTLGRCAAFAMLVLLGSISYARAMMRSAPSSVAHAESFPQQIGGYKLQREWDETMATGQVVFHWAEYRDAGGDGDVSIGVSPVLGAHDTLICHAARGDDWSWHGPLQFQTAAGVTSLSASLFNTGSTQYLEATTICSGVVCGQSSTERSHFGFIYSRPAAHDLLTQNPARPIPVLLRAELPDAAIEASDARAKLTRRLATFLSGVNLAQFTQPYRER
jgi:exosortase J